VDSESGLNLINCVFDNCISSVKTCFNDTSCNGVLQCGVECGGNITCIESTCLKNGTDSNLWDI